MSPVSLSVQQVTPDTNTCGAIQIDVNGKNSPNIIGKDTFQFVILKNTVVPNKIDDCEAGSDGWLCAGWVLENENMDYFKCTDLFWSGNKKCISLTIS